MTSRNNITILVADHLESTRQAIIRSLKAARFRRVVEVDDGQAALDTIEEMADAGRPPNVIVADIGMPGLSGLRLTQRIKEDPRLRSLPVIVFGLNTGDDKRKQCRAAGVDRQLTQPQLPRLVDTIEELLASAATV
jgi:two-component system chemotaxis response regulator CheV